jgi:hypothetical protein
MHVRGRESERWWWRGVGLSYEGERVGEREGERVRERGREGERGRGGKKEGKEAPISFFRPIPELLVREEKNRMVLTYFCGRRRRAYGRDGRCEVGCERVSV